MLRRYFVHECLRVRVLLSLAFLPILGELASCAPQESPSTRPSKDLAAGANNWLSSRGDNLNTGQSHSAVDATKGEEVWQFIASSKVVTTPVVADGVVYIASSDSSLIALNSKTGKLIWQSPRRGADQIYSFSAPVIIGTHIVAATQNGTVTCFNRADAKVIWEITIPGEIYSSLRHADGRIFFGSKNRFIYALDAATGAILWKYECGDEVGSTCAISRKGRVIFPSHDKFLHVIDAATGASVQKHDIGYRSAGTPLLANGCVYYVMTGRKFGCIDLVDGSMRWSTEALSENTQGIGLWKDQVMVHIGRYLMCFDMNSGRSKWKATLDGSGCVAPCIGKQLVYMGDSKGTYVALDLETGAEKWRISVPGGGWCAPVLVDGLVYLADGNGIVRAVR